MPIFLWLFFGTVGAGIASIPFDQPPARKSTGRHHTPVTYNVSASPDSLAYSKPNLKRQMVCELSFTGTVTGNGKAVFSAGQKDYGVGNGWTIYSTVPVNSTNVAHFQFLDPKTGKLLAEITKTVRCVHDPGTDYGALYNTNGTLKGY